VNTDSAQDMPKGPAISEDTCTNPVIRLDSTRNDGTATPDEQTRDWFRVLVVDDEPVSRRQISHFLTQAGHQALTAGDGREGLDMALKHAPHLVITDWMMPERDGPELCRALRASPGGALLYIIMLTMHEEEDRLVEAFRAGANDYLVKPIKRRVLAARFNAGRRMVELHRALERERDENRLHIAELSVLNRRLEESAMTDALTGLPNRRYALEQLEREWSATGRTQSPLACMLIDVDKFKEINDSCGHDVGDLALQSTAAVLRDAARRSDVVCRLGGDEFLVICNGIHPEEARTLGERLRGAVEAREMLNRRSRVTVTIGVATRGPAMLLPADLLRAADQALLRAKRAKRNSVVLADASQP
jgi:two-component system cell cycle response regulator